MRIPRVVLGVTASAAIAVLTASMAYATGNVPESLMPGSLVNGAWIQEHCRAESGDPWQCPNPGMPSPGSLAEGYGPAMVAFGDSYSSGEGAPFNSFAIYCSMHQHGGAGLPLPANCDDEGAEKDEWLPVSGFYPGTDDSKNACHRSPTAYPVRMAVKLHFNNLDFRACSGAVSNDYLVRRDQPPNGSPEVAAPWNHETDGSSLAPQGAAPWPADTRLATVGFGGNNVLFSTVIKTCIGTQGSIQYPLEALKSVPVAGLAVAELAKKYLPADINGKTDCAPFVDSVTKSIPELLGANGKPQGDQKIDTLPENSVVRVYREIRQIAPSEARVIAIGYPRMFPVVPFGECGMGTGEANTGRGEQLALNNFVSTLNATLKQAATDADIDFVDIEDAYVPRTVTQPGDPNNHGLCRDQNDQRWINRFKIRDAHTASKDMNGAFHPTPAGQQVAADAMVDCYLDERACSNFADRRIAKSIADNLTELERQEALQRANGETARRAQEEAQQQREDAAGKEASGEQHPEGNSNKNEDTGTGQTQDQTSDDQNQDSGASQSQDTENGQGSPAKIEPEVLPSREGGNCTGPVVYSQEIEADGKLAATVSIHYNKETGKNCALLTKGPEMFYGKDTYMALQLRNESTGKTSTDMNYYPREAGPVWVAAKKQCLSYTVSMLNPARTRWVFQEVKGSGIACK